MGVRIKRSVRKVLLGLFVLITMFATSFTILVKAVQYKAEAFLKDYSRLEIGKATFNDAQLALSKYDDHLSYSEGCTPTDCRIEYVFENMWLKHLHLAPATGFGGTMIFRDGMLSSRITFLGQGRYFVNHITEAEVLRSPPDPSNPDFGVVLERDEQGRPEKGGVWLTPKATHQQRERAYNLNLSCLARIGGCKTAEELSPSIWRAN